MKQRFLAGQTYNGLRIITITYDGVSRRTVIEFEYDSCPDGPRFYELEPDFRRILTFREFNEAETTEGI